MNVEQILKDQGIDYYESGMKRFVVSCPYHDDSTPSAGIWMDSGYFHCWGCHMDASFAEYLSEASDLTLHEALRLVRGEDDVSDLEENIRDFLHRDDSQFKFFSVKSFRTNYPALEKGSPEWKYVIGRGISPEMIRLFNMRKGTGKYKRRVVLPIFDEKGRLVSYVGRSINPSAVSKTRKARSPHRALFGLRELLRSSLADRYVLVVVEGEFDAIYLQQHGIAAVSNMGTMPPTADKVRLFRRYAKKVVLSFDADEAGHNATYGHVSKTGKWIPGYLEALEPHVPVVSVELPEGCDPNELTAEQIEEIYGGLR